jgi:SMC interacting uncharacterized protein involved in chromosome segregation
MEGMNAASYDDSSASVLPSVFEMFAELGRRMGEGFFEIEKKMIKLQVGVEKVQEDIFEVKETMDKMGRKIDGVESEVNEVKGMVQDIEKTVDSILQFQ